MIVSFSAAILVALSTASAPPSAGQNTPGTESRPVQAYPTAQSPSKTLPMAQAPGKTLPTGQAPSKVSPQR